MTGLLYVKRCLKAESTATLPSGALLGDLVSLQTPSVASSFPEQLQLVGMGRTHIQEQRASVGTVLPTWGSVEKTNAASELSLPLGPQILRSSRVSSPSIVPSTVMFIHGREEAQDSKQAGARS